jgi:phospholipid/cholesterol/gamma-HCH transport system substrate-binding protein
MRTRRSETRVGLLVLAALIISALALFLVGEEGNLFAAKNRYYILFGTVGGLHEGAPVQLNGVKVGTVERIVLPEDAGAEMLEVHISVDRRYASRVRQDSMAKIRTMGLLGDKYVDLKSGSRKAAQIEPGGQIPAAAVTDVDRLIASGEDVVENVVAISHSLNNILDRMDRGEGLLGTLTSDPETGRKMTESVLATMESIQNLTHTVESGTGALPRLINDRALGERLALAVGNLETVLARAEKGEGALPALLNDAGTRQALDETLSSLNSAADSLAAIGEKLEDASGFLPRLLEDEAYGQRLGDELEQLIVDLREAAEKLNRGNGTAAQLINDPGIHDAVQDIVVGVNDSRFLRWLIRNRQKAGIRKRYEEASSAAAAEDGAAPEE